jgi:hypothetical protein
MYIEDNEESARGGDKNFNSWGEEKELLRKSFKTFKKANVTLNTTGSRNIPCRAIPYRESPAAKLVQCTTV